MALAAGIDLGTTKSVVCVWRDGHPEVVPSAEGERWTPSVVAFPAVGDPLVGAAAKRQAVVNPDSTFWSFKHLFGVVDESATVLGRHYAPSELAAHVLRKMASDVLIHTGEPLTRAVMTVPTMFGVAQRAVLAQAARAAGIELVRIIEEPVAAALAYGLESGQADTGVLTFDLGGGTLDVAVLEVGRSRDGAAIYDVQAVAGDTRLGGDDWDRRIVDQLIQEFRSEHEVDLSADPVAMQRLRDAAEQAKIDLTASEAATVFLPYVARTSAEFLTLERIVTRAELEMWTGDLLARCRTVLDQATEAAWCDLKHVVMVGGASRMPAVAELVRSHTGLDPYHGINPDEVVAVGAARQAAVLAGLIRDSLLLNVVPMPLGIEHRGGTMATFIDRNTTIPTRRTEILSTGQDDVELLLLHVLQGNRMMSVFDEPLAVLEIPVTSSPAGTPQVEVTMDVDTNGLINVSGFDRALGERRDVTVTAESARAARRQRARTSSNERDARLPILPGEMPPRPEPDPAPTSATGAQARKMRADGDTGPHAFLSYSRADAEYAERLVAHLAGAGITVWWDGDVEPSDDWVLLLEDRIRASVAVLAVMSPSAERSKWVRRELLFAEDIGKPILPLRLAGRRMLQLFELQDEDVRTGLMPSDRFMARLARLASGADSHMA